MRNGRRYCKSGISYSNRAFKLTTIGSLAKFSWGHAFWKMNADLIKRYRTCHTHGEVMEMQDLIQKEMVDDRTKRKAEKGLQT